MELPTVFILSFLLLSSFLGIALIGIYLIAYRIFRASIDGRIAPLFVSNNSALSQRKGIIEEEKDKIAQRHYSDWCWEMSGIGLGLKITLPIWGILIVLVIILFITF